MMASGFSMRAKWRALKSGRWSVPQKVLDRGDSVRDGLFSLAIVASRGDPSFPRSREGDFAPSENVGAINFWVADHSLNPRRGLNQRSAQRIVPIGTRLTPTAADEMLVSPSMSTTPDHHSHSAQAGRLLATTLLTASRNSGGVMHLLRSRSARSNPDGRSASPLRRMTGTLG